MTIVFKVDDMTCGHCVAVITQAVKEADHAARVVVDLAARRVEIEPKAAQVEELRKAIAEAGYTPVTA
jgi:copper chaperone